MLTENESVYYKKCMEIYAELNSNNFPYLKERLEDLQHQCIQRLTRLEDKALLREQGKLEIINDLLDYKKIVSGQIEQYKILDDHEK